MDRRAFLRTTLTSLAVGATTKVIVPGRPTHSAAMMVHRPATTVLLVTPVEDNFGDAEATAMAITAELQEALKDDGQHVIVSPVPLRIESVSLPQDPDGVLVVTGEDLNQDEVDALMGLFSNSLGDDPNIIVTNFHIFTDAQHDLDDLRNLRDTCDRKIAEIEARAKA